jgi:hypothetical protein
MLSTIIYCVQLLHLHYSIIQYELSLSGIECKRQTDLEWSRYVLETISQLTFHILCVIYFGLVLLFVYDDKIYKLSILYHLGPRFIPKNIFEFPEIFANVSIIRYAT